MLGRKAAAFRDEAWDRCPRTAFRFLLQHVSRCINSRFALGCERTMNSAGSDLTALRADLNGLKDTVTKFISQVSSEAAKSAREVTSSVADQVGGVATDYVGKGAEMTSAASEQAKTVASELESMARRNPLGAIAGAMLIGVFIGLLGRRN